MPSLNVLKAIWGKRKGYVFVPRKKGKVWDNGRAFNYPDEWDVIKTRIEQSEADGYDVYWCPLVFDGIERVKSQVQQYTGILWADLDDVNPASLGDLRPSIAWKSSNTKYQCLWILDGEHSTNQIEELNKALTYRIGADKSGWDVTQVLRVPGTSNHKYSPPQQGQLLWAEKRIFEFDVLKGVLGSSNSTAVEGIQTIDELLDGWQIPRRTLDLIYTPEEQITTGERSDRLWEIETSLLEAGMPVMSVVQIIQQCAWNKFKGRRDELGQIYREVMKADAQVKNRAKGVTHELDPSGDSLKKDLWATPYDTFMGTKIDPPEWLVDGIWQRGTYGMIAGEPKTYKSVLATDLGLSIASGTDFLGTFKVFHTGAVLYIQEENSQATVQDRLYKIANSKGLLMQTEQGLAFPDSLPFYISNNYGFTLTSKDDRILLEQTIQQINPVLVILDPLYMMLGDADENSASEVRDILKWLSYLRNTYGCAILVLHHYNKGGANAPRGGNRVRGTSQFHGWVESALYIKKITDAVNEIKIEREFRSFPSTPELTVRIHLGEPKNLLFIPEVYEENDSINSDVMCNNSYKSQPTVSKTDEETDGLLRITRMETRELITSGITHGIIRRVSAGEHIDSVRNEVQSSGGIQHEVEI